MKRRIVIRSQHLVEKSERIKNPSPVFRNTLITQKNLGKYYNVHNGKEHIVVFATTSKLGTKFGEYSFTRRAGLHMKKKKKKK